MGRDSYFSLPKTCSEQRHGSAERLGKLFRAAARARAERKIARTDRPHASGANALDLFLQFFVLLAHEKLQEQIDRMRLEQTRLQQDADQARRLQALLGFKEQ